MRNSIMRIRSISSMLSIVCLVLAALCVPSFAHGAMTGSVTGHVYCADTNRPCRFATIDLLAKSAHGSASVKDLFDNKMFTGTSGLDGSFTIANVPPGSYDVIALLPGYLSHPANPFSGPLDAGSAANDPSTKFQTVSVEPNQTSSLTIVMERGAAIGGSVRYDDGSPAVGITVDLLRKQQDGSWKSVQKTAGPFAFLLGTTALTDDRGGYRRAGLMPGLYTVEAKLPVVEMFITGPSGKMSSTLFSTSADALQVYLENATRLSDAKTVELRSGDEWTGADITIPVTGLHSLAGTVTAKFDGHAIGHGTIQLLDPKDKTVLRTTELHKDGTFAFRYVPEGSYTVKIDGLKDSSDGAPAHIYGKIEQPLTVQGDMNALVFVAPENGTATNQGQQ